jgi:diaminopimelate epimerase
MAPAMTSSSSMPSNIDFTPAQWRRLADRRFGIGADQILVVEEAAPGQAAFPLSHLLMANDGEVEHENAAAARAPSSSSSKGCVKQDQHPRGNHGRHHCATPGADGSITVGMGAPCWSQSWCRSCRRPRCGVAEGDDTVWLDLALPGTRVLVSVVSMGSPHADASGRRCGRARPGTIGPAHRAPATFFPAGSTSATYK